MLDSQDHRRPARGERLVARALSRGYATIHYWLSCALLITAVGCEVDVEQSAGPLDMNTSLLDASGESDGDTDGGVPLDTSIAIDAMPMLDAAFRLDGALRLDGAVEADVGNTADAETSTDGTTNDAMADVDMMPIVDAAPFVDMALDETLEEAITRVLNENGVVNMRTRLPPMEIASQAANFGGQVSFIDALEAALLSFMTDGSDIESPRSLAAKGDPGQCANANLTERVRCFLNRDTALLELYGEEGFAPENGETVEMNWIFVLRAESLSDHIQWAIIDRSGDRAVYNYGFN
jgi:hypothetical protein